MMKRVVICGLSLIVLAYNGDPTQLIERFNRYCYDNYHGAPVFVFGTLEQAMDEAFEATPMEHVRLAVYV